MSDIILTDIEWLPAIMPISLYRNNVCDYLDSQYRVFLKDFMNSSKPLLFEGIPVYIEDKLLDCSNCNFKCNNTHFKCEKCPYLDKYEIFQHITSDKDLSLVLDKKYIKNCNKRKKKLNKRVPGIYNNNRTSKIHWIRKIIENHSDTDNVKFFKAPDKDDINVINKYFWLYEKQFTVILAERTLSNKKKVQYLKTTYCVLWESLEYDFKNKHQKYVRNPY